MSLEPWAFAVDCCRGDFFRPFLDVEKNSVRFLAFCARVCSCVLFFPLVCVGERDLKEPRGEWRDLFEVFVTALAPTCSARWCRLFARTGRETSLPFLKLSGAPRSNNARCFNQLRGEA